MNKERRDAMIALCAARGLEVTDVHLRGVLLELTPSSLEQLPSAETLRALADELGGDGVRYVALALEARDA